MLIARVVGDLTATQKHSSHEGAKLLLVQPLELDGTNRGPAVVAVDSVNAGVGDRVLLVQDGYAAMTSMGRPQAPIDMAVLGIIDHVEMLSTAVETPVAAAVPAAARKQSKKNRS
jgi:ethanolamine utilization protein EutN